VSRPHEFEVEAIRQNHDPSLGRPLSHLPDHLKHTTSVLGGFDDHQPSVRGTILEALWTCDRSDLDNGKKASRQNLLKARAQQGIVTNQSRWDRWVETAGPWIGLRGAIMYKRECLRSHPCPLFNFPVKKM
jgi:hypothetical protein